MLSFSYWAELKILPNVWSLWKDCIEKFDIYLEMWLWEQALASDLMLESNMEFVNFENAWLFWYYIPPRQLWVVNHLTLVNLGWKNITWWWLLWHVYYKVVSDEKPYIKFYFYGNWKTDDTNVSIDWRDILTRVYWWNYVVDWSLKCNEFTWDIYSESDFYDSVNVVVTELNKLDNNSHKIYSFCCIWWFIIIIVVVLLFVYLRKWRK